MECIYINLDNQLERRKRIEEEFRTHNRKNWKLHRLSAVSASVIQHSHEFMTAQEIACFISHTQAISAATKIAGHVMILEDDASFSSETFDRIENFLPRLSRHQSWDLLFTQVGAFEATTMAYLCSTKERLTGDQTSCHDIKSLFPHVWGSASYIINASSKLKVLDALRYRNHTIPLDIHLMKLVHDRKLNGFLTIPFFTYLNDTSVISQLRDNARRCQYFDYLFRKLMSVGFDKNMMPEIEKNIGDNFNFVKSPFLSVLGSFLSPEINQEREKLVEQKPRIINYLSRKETNISEKSNFVNEFDLKIP